MQALRAKVAALEAILAAMAVGLPVDEKDALEERLAAKRNAPVQAGLIQGASFHQAICPEYSERPLHPI